MGGREGGTEKSDIDSESPLALHSLRCSGVLFRNAVANIRRKASFLGVVCGVCEISGSILAPHDDRSAYCLHSFATTEKRLFAIASDCAARTAFRRGFSHDDS